MTCVSLQVRHTPDEAHPERSSQRNLHQAAGGGARAQRQLRARGVCVCESDEPVSKVTVE